MASIADLGIGVGLIYVTEPDGTTFVKTGIENIAENVPGVLQMGVGAASTALNKRAMGTITFSVAPTGSGSLSAVTILGVNQIADSIAYTVADTTTTLATNVAAAINSFAPASGYDYTAISVANAVYILAPTAAGSAVNGSAITVTVSTDPPTYTTKDVDGGSNNTNSYSESWGLRFFLNANYDAGGCACGGDTAQKADLTNAIEITDYIIPLGLQSSLPTQSQSIVSGKITITRRASIMYYVVDTESSAASDNLDSVVVTADFVNGDTVIMRGANSGRVVTITSSGNINTVTSFATADKDTHIVLTYIDGTWYEVARSGGNYVPTAAAFRTALFPFLNAKYGSTVLTVEDNTTVTLTSNTEKKYQSVEGTVSLTTGDYDIVLSNTDAIAGDEFYIEYSAAVTIGAYNVNIGGIQLSADEALTGKLMVKAYYDGAGWIYTMYPDTNQGYQMYAANIAAGAITVSKLATELKYELIVFDISFESGEQGDYKIKMPYAGSVSEFYARAVKAIAATDDATITPKNNGGTTMTAGTITFTASDAFGTAVTTTPSANNTFVAGDLLTFTSAKTTAGGKAQVSMKIIRA